MNIKLSILKSLRALGPIKIIKLPLNSHAYAEIKNYQYIGFGKKFPPSFSRPTYITAKKTTKTYSN